MDTALQLQLAREAGFNENSGQSWEEDYKYHLGMVDNPFPFERFRMKQSLFDQLVKSPLDTESIDKKIHQLSLELGY